jgi:hypothetical protein
MITPAYRKQIRKIFYHYKRLLAIPKYWHVKIDIDESITEYANVEFDYDDKKFNIHINPKLNQDLDVLKDSILHELTHVLFSPATIRLDLLLKKIQCNEKFNYKLSKKRISDYEEYLVNHITKILIAQEAKTHDKKPTP